MRILQINTVVNSGSTGRIAEDIGKVLMANGHESFIAYGRGNQKSQSQLIKIGTQKDVIMHGIKSMVFDRHAFGSQHATEKLIEQIEAINPDVIGLHNVHGYYLNIEVLFNYIAEKKIPVIWTLHDCWAFTGHCAYFDSVSCEKWKTICHKCPKTRSYPTSYLMDNSQKNFLDKKRIFNQVANGTIVTPSRWLKNLVEESFLNYPAVNIHNGIDIEIFRPNENKADIREKYNISGDKIILGVASIWDVRKGLADFIKLHEINNGRYQIILVGVSEKQQNALPKGIIGIRRTENTHELASLYSLADVFVNPTYQDNFPTTNIEALACGTPVITYKTGGSPEAIDDCTGIVVPKGEITALNSAINNILDKGKAHFSAACRERAENRFNKDDRYMEYLELYEKVRHSPK